MKTAPPRWSDLFGIDPDYPSDGDEGSRTGMRVTVTSPIQHLCPYRDEVDYGSVEITFEIDGGDAPELHGIADYLQALRNTTASHEDVTRLILDNTEAARVVTRWQTAGMDVTCDLSSEPNG